jgi:hypothetical protein
MGIPGRRSDRFVLIRSDSKTGRVEAGNQAIRNVGQEPVMRAELAAAVGGLVTNINTEDPYALEEAEIDQLIKAANIVTHSRTAVERDYRGDILDAHSPEMPTRFIKQLCQLVRGGLAPRYAPRRGPAARPALCPR